MAANRDNQPLPSSLVDAPFMDVPGLRLYTGAEDALARYVALPVIPKGRIHIKKMGFLRNVKYGDIRRLDPKVYPSAKDASDYTDDDEVTPAIFTTTDGVEYRVPALVWFPLDDVMSQILSRRCLNPFPMWLELDPNSVDAWMTALMVKARFRP